MCNKRKSMIIAPETKRRLQFFSFDPKNYNVVAIVSDGNVDVPISLGPQNKRIFKCWTKLMGLQCHDLSEFLPFYD